jgi:hypothetical protein
VRSFESENHGLGMLGFKNKNTIGREVLVKRGILGIIVLSEMFSSWQF